MTLVFALDAINKPFDFLHIKKTLQSCPWNWPVLGISPGFLMRIHRINDSVELKLLQLVPAERWVSEKGGLRHEPSYKFFSFNAGPRTCSVVEILQNFDIEVVKGHKVEPFPDLYLHMKHGLKVTFKKRCST
ncbi:hypothetical protein YC2023_042395 [Brassica napus]